MRPMLETDLLLELLSRARFVSGFQHRRDLLGDLFGDLFGDLLTTWSPLGPNFPCDFVYPLCGWPEGRRKESVGCELRLRTFVPFCLFSHPPDSRTCLLDKGNAMEEVSNERIASHTAGAKLRPGQPFRQTSWVADLDPVIVDLDEDVRAHLEIVPVHHRISDRFAQGTHGVLGHILAP